MSKRKAGGYREPAWFRRNLNEMTQIANESAREGFYRKLRSKIVASANEALKGGKYQSVYGLICSQLSSLSWDSMAKGAIAVINNDLEGWRELRRGFLYDCWAARLRHAFVVLDNCYDDSRNVASAAIFSGKEALTLCHAIAVGDDEFAHGFGRHLLGNLAKTNGSDKLYFYKMPFFPFTIKLYSVWTKTELAFRPDIPNPLGKYQSIFDSWNSPEDLAVALLDACDLHCEEADDSSPYATFAFFPYNLFPVEMMSILRIRRELGLENPPLIHPLLGSAIVHPPATFLTVDDPLLACVIRRFRSDLGSLPEEMRRKVWCE